MMQNSISIQNISEYINFAVYNSYMKLLYWHKNYVMTKENINLKKPVQCTQFHMNYMYEKTVIQTKNFQNSKF